MERHFGAFGNSSGSDDVDHFHKIADDLSQSHEQLSQLLRKHWVPDEAVDKCVVALDLGPGVRVDGEASPQEDDGDKAEHEGLKVVPELGGAACGGGPEAT